MDDNEVLAAGVGGGGHCLAFLSILSLTRQTLQEGSDKSKPKRGVLCHSLVTECLCAVYKRAKRTFGMRIVQILKILNFCSNQK
jgi:hypothetical protein